MIAALLIAGIGFVLAGLLGIVVGIPVKEFSFGNTLILAGAVTTCTGMIMLGLWMVVRELRTIAQRLGQGDVASFQSSLSGLDTGPTLHDPENAPFLFGREQPGAAPPVSEGPATPPPWLEETATRDRGRSNMPPLPGSSTESAAKPRRNLLFSSTTRKERERAAELLATDHSTVEPRSTPAPGSSPAKSSEPSAAFEDSRPYPERGKAVDAPASRRGGRMPSTFAEANSGATGADRPSAPAAHNEDPAAVSVLKSGVVDGMAYSLYSDGSIEAQLPEGLMRFASIDELRAHLDQRP
jgi:hypothetical protein